MIRRKHLSDILYAASESRVYAKRKRTRNDCPYVTIHSGGGIMSIVPARSRLSGNHTVHVYLNRVTESGEYDSEYEGEYTIGVVVRFIHALGRMKPRDMPAMWHKISSEKNVRCEIHAGSVFVALTDGIGHRVSDVQVVQLRDDGWWYLTGEVEAKT